MKIKLFDVPFTQVPNEILNDKNLSLVSKGLWTYMQGKPDGWVFSAIRISQESADSAHVIRKSLNELCQKGYVLRKKMQSGHLIYQLTTPSLHHKKEIPQIAESATSEIRRLQKVQVAESATYINKEGTINKDNTHAEASSASSPFNWKDYLKEMEDDKRRSINIIGHYFEEKGLKFSSRSEAAVAIKRHLRAANSVAAFSDDKIVWATDKAKKDYGELFTIET
ncbi:MAG: hypothetical protein KW793_03215, partial [Candidatus Doudnabacteria bacterium]|nr:hypothetical protein [Candidatus Doudnabacteria bacterium]